MGISMANNKIGNSLIEIELSNYTIAGKIVSFY